MMKHKIYQKNYNKTRLIIKITGKTMKLIFKIMKMNIK